MNNNNDHYKDKSKNSIDHNKQKNTAMTSENQEENGREEELRKNNVQYSSIEQ